LDHHTRDTLPDALERAGGLVPWLFACLLACLFGAAVGYVVELEPLAELLNLIGG
jgi:hypothetical protein